MEVKQKNLFYILSLTGMLAVILGAFGAHSLKELIDPSRLAIYKTGIQYQFYHLVLMGILSILYLKFSSQWFYISFHFTSAGIILFSGSLYLLACRTLLGIESWTWLGSLTPLGGLCFIIAWILMGLGVFKLNR